MVVDSVTAGFGATLSSDASAALVAEGTVKQLTPGQTLYRQGEPARSVGVVTYGHLRLSTTGTQGRGELVLLVEPGEVVGLVGALERGCHIGTATAIDDVGVLEVDIDRFEHVMAYYPEGYPALVRHLARWVALAWRPSQPKARQDGF